MKKQEGVELGDNGYEVNRNPNISNEPNTPGINQLSDSQLELIKKAWYEEGYIDGRYGRPNQFEDNTSCNFTHHELNESLYEAIKAQMEDDGDVDDFIRKGIDDIVVKYAALGAQWYEQQILKK